MNSFKFDNNRQSLGRTYPSTSTYQTDKGCPTKHEIFECLLPYTVLHIKDFSQFISLKNSFSQICFTLKSNLLFYECHIIFFYYSLWYQTTQQIMEEDI